MVTNVLPPFYGSQCIYKEENVSYSPVDKFSSKWRFHRLAEPAWNFASSRVKLQWWRLLWWCSQ